MNSTAAPYKSPPASTILHLCPARPSELELEVPDDAWWPGQRETIASIIHAFFAGIKFVCASIPTGGGKTVIAAAVQKILANHSGAYGGRSLALTHTIQLQQQYIKTLKDAKVVVGRSNFLCELPPEHPAKLGEMLLGDSMPLTAENAPCVHGGGCDVALNRRKGCGYYAQLYEAADAPMTVMNYAYAARILPIANFRERSIDGSVQSMGNPFRRELLVMDECHLAHDALVEAAGHTLYVSTLLECGVNLPPEHTKIAVEEGGPRSRKTVYYENVELWRHWAIDVALPAIKKRLSEVREELNGLGSAVLESRPERQQSFAAAYGKAARLQLRLLSAEKAVLAIAAIDNPNIWSIKRNYSARNNNVVTSIQVQPLWGWDVIPRMVLDHFTRVLLMSATPGDPEVLRVIMGIPKESWVYIERPSTFPVANRPIIYWPVAKLNYKSTDEDWARIADAIVKISERGPHAQRKGLVHTGSAANAKRLTALLNARYGWSRAFTHGQDEKYNREEALAEFINSPQPRVLVTASFTTGLDLPYIIGWQVIAKVPYGNLGDEITSRRRQFKLESGYAFGQTYYESQCMNTVVQAAGRIVRSPTDSGPTYILDANYAQLHARAFKPQFYKDAFRRVQ